MQWIRSACAVALMMFVLLFSVVSGHLFPVSLGVVVCGGSWSAARRAPSGTAAARAILGAGVLLAALVVYLAWPQETGDSLRAELAAVLAAAAPLVWALVLDYLESGRTSSLVTAVGVPVVIGAGGGVVWVWTGTLEAWIVSTVALTTTATVLVENLTPQAQPPSGA